MIDVIVWALLISALGWLAFPLAYRFFPALADRGWAFARPLGLILWGFAFWLLTSLQILQNDSGGELLALGLVGALSVWSLISIGWANLRLWMSEHKGRLITTEVLFLLAFMFMALMRAADPGIQGTEKPMEMAFINAILHSPGFPPNDPWLSGYAISYYYFGYVMVAMIIRITGVLPGIGYNLAGSLWFALTAVSAYGVVANLLSVWSQRRATRGLWTFPASIGGLLGPFFVLIMSNLEGIFEVLHRAGVFWQRGADGKLTSEFWAWLNLQELNIPPVEPFSLDPQRLGGIWWWRASRVIQDFSLGMRREEVIDEFPFFTYYLGDIHPHVLSMPFVLLAVGLALNLYLVGSQKGFAPFKFTEWLKRAEFWLMAVVLGGLSFLNTWDFPIYVGFVAGTYTLGRYLQCGWSGERIKEFALSGITLGAAGGLLYFPFYLGFASQAGGVMPSMSFFTRGVHFWIMFGSLLTPIVCWLAWLWGGQKRSGFWRGLKFSASIFGLLLVGMLLLGFLAVNLSVLGNLLAGSGIASDLALKMISAGPQFYSLHDASNLQSLFLGSLSLRLTNPGTWLTLLILLALVWGRFGGMRKAEPEEIQPRGESPQPFVLLMVLVGVALVTVPEFIYLRDQFGTRMNTIFKFFFQTWMLWACVAAFAVVVLLHELGGLKKYFFAIVTIVVLGIALIYPFYGIAKRFENVKELTLDGTAFIQNYNPDEMSAIRWLSNAPTGVVLEAVGGSYSGYARISTHSGQSTVLGWPGHEGQWRGSGREMGSRQADIERIYTSTSWEEAAVLLNKYQVRYIYIGSLERNTFVESIPNNTRSLNDVKFKRNLKAVFQNASVIIYEYLPTAGSVSK